MAEFAIRDLGVLNYNNGFTFWFYKGGAGITILDMLSPGFFDDANDMIARGDMIMANCAGNAPDLPIEGCQLFVTEVRPTVKIALMSRSVL